MSSLRLPCSDCNDDASVQVFSDGSFCHACRTQSKYKSLVSERKKTSKVFHEYDSEIPDIGLKHLRKYRVTQRLQDLFRIGWSREYQRVVFPYYKDSKLLFAWLRDPTGLKQPKWLFAGKKGIEPYYFMRPDTLYYTNLIITEDVVSAIRCSAFADILALGGTNFKDPSLLPIFLKYPILTVWLDGDKAGRDAATAFKKRYHVTRPVKIIRTKADPKVYSDREIQEILK